MAEILGIDHVGVGVKNMDIMKEFYQGLLEFTEIFGEMPEGDHEPIHALMRSCPTIHSAIQMNQKCGGISVALFCHTYPKPRPIRQSPRYGDIGVSKATIAIGDLDQFYKEFQGRIAFCSQIRRIKIPGWGDYAFVYARDPEGNLIEFIDGEKFSVNQRLGGVRWIGIGVTDLERSIDYYQKILGFDKTVINIHESFSGNLDEIAKYDQAKFRSCVLGTNRGNSMVELFEAIKPRGRSVPFFTNWGDFGYLQLCLLADNIFEIEKYFLSKDVEIIVNPQVMSSDDPENAGLAFLYTRDLDGIPVEVMTLPKNKT